MEKKIIKSQKIINIGNEIIITSLDTETICSVIRNAHMTAQLSLF
jgi:hypothetical protein